MFIKDYIARYKNSNNDDKFAMLILSFLPFTTIVFEILINIMERGDVVNTCSNTGVSLIGFVPIQIVYLLLSVSVGSVGALLLAGITSLIIKSVDITKLISFNSPEKVELKYDYVIESNDSKISIYKKMLKNRLAKTILFFSGIPSMFLSIGFIALFAVIAFLFVPVDQCLNTNGKQIAVMGNMVGSLLISGGIIFGLLKINIISILNASMVNDYSDTLSEINNSRLHYFKTYSLNYKTSYRNSLYSICEEAANNLNLYSVNNAYGVFDKNGVCLINIEPKLKSNLDYIIINVEGNDTIIKINKYASLTAVKSELVKIIVDQYNKSKVKV